jgi:hypothetical protein
VEARILVIDDGLDSWNLLSLVLRTHRYQPIWAADGIQLLNEARKHQPHVILGSWSAGGRRRWRTRTTEESPAAVGYSSDYWDGARPCGGGAKGPGVRSGCLAPEAREGG